MFGGGFDERPPLVPSSSGDLTPALGRLPAMENHPCR
jgi:hypothetical protein